MKDNPEHGSVQAPQAQPLRGLMLDAARLVESPDYYRRFIDFCAAWRVNAVIFRLADDQGCAMRFRSHPELVTHPQAMTPDAMRGLADYARQQGVQLIPEIESLGHAHYITRTPAHADLDDTGDTGPGWANAMIPLHPKTLRLLGDLYEEVAAIFPSPYLHAGCDETNWGASAFSRELLRTRSRAQVWGEYLNALHASIRALGKEMIIWDDMVLQNDPAILDQLDRRIILYDWQYADTTAAPVLARLALGLQKGFRMIGGPALCWGRGPRPGTPQLRNIDAYVDACGAVADARVLGVIVTNWQPTTYLQGSLWDGLAYAAVAMDEGATRARASALPRFVERHYGAVWDKAWAGMFAALYDATPTRRDDTPIPLIPPWSNTEELDAAIGAGHVFAPPFAALPAQLDRLQDHVRRNPADFAAFRLCVAYLAHLYWRQGEVVKAARAGRDVNAVLREVARRDAALDAALAADWAAGRPGDPAAGLRDAATWGFYPDDWLHARFHQAAEFTRGRWAPARE